MPCGLRVGNLRQDGRVDQHELLIRHALAWADKRKQPLDRDLLGTVLNLRDFHDLSAPQEWPAGSAEHLMLVRWPSHGPSGVPDVDRLVETLDSFWRFLRGTGRMASSSADPRELAKEARRAAPRMPDACADPTRHGAAKSLVEFGESIGLSLDEAGSMEELNERMQQIVEAWNALPDDQRMAMSPSSAHQGSLRGMAATDLMASLMDDDDGLDDVFGLSDEDGNIPFADLSEVATDVRAAPFVQQCRRLVGWVGERGREITPKGVLRLAPAREAYDLLGLGEWEREADRLAYGDLVSELPLESQELWVATARESFRSAADCRPLHRLWTACLEAGLLELSRTRVYAAWDEPASEEEWRHLGVVLASAVLINAAPIHVSPLMGALLHLLDPARESMPLTELEDWWWQSPKNHHTLVGRRDETARRWSDSALHRALHEMEDLRVWRRDGDALLPTAFGHDVALLASALVDNGVIDT